ncbi:hypothetical protein L2E82_21459 [Cichorium intybus]|uniref:Uncharacterized protein n=1 Tax=Cichorium intybus TaxID=13427 RepID=A0ACB9DVX1_CICIN|nr:hypothetical protein L2E82_21459 [Cichorium intybus]
MKHQLEGVQKSLKKLQSFSKEKDVSKASQRARDHLRVLYDVEDEIEKFTFQVARQRKKFGFLMKQTFFFNNLNSCRRLKRKIKKIHTRIPSSPQSGGSTTSSSEHGSVRTISDVTTEEESQDDDDDDDFSNESQEMAQKSSSDIWVISEIPSTPSPRQRFLTRSFTMLLHPEKIHMSNFSSQEEELGVFGLNDDIKRLVKWLTQPRERNISRFIDTVNIPVKKQMSKNEMFVPIVGESGSGKTTLVHAVYRNRKIRDHFEFHYWISVTEEYTTKLILHNVSKKMALVKENGIEAYKKSLFNHLKDKKYLIVIDGVGSRVVEDLKQAFPDESNGSKVIFTTREDWRSPEMNINPHIMNPLSETDSCGLFMKNVGKEKEATRIQTVTKCKILIAGLDC